MIQNSPIIILGTGYTGIRLANSLISAKIPIFAAGREPAKFAPKLAAEVVCTALDAAALPAEARLVYSIPPVGKAESGPLRLLVRKLNPRRLVYISSTSVYGEQTKVDENSPVELTESRGIARLEDENFLSAGTWSTLILRPAAIYGPGRGVHTRVRDGLIPRGMGATVTSRIHVDDLVRIIASGLDSDLEGAWPLADQLPCSTAEIAEWCALRMGLTAVQATQPLKTVPQLRLTPTSPHSGRSVDGSAIFRALGLTPRWPTWKIGIPACLAEEEREGLNRER